MNLKIKTFIALTSIFTISWTTFWYFEQNMFCNIKKDNIIVSLNQNDWLKCQEYTKYIEQKMKSTYLDVLTMQWYINKRQDAGYRKPIKDAKVKQINDLQKLRLSVLASMKVFEKSLLDKSKQFFLSEVQPYQKKLTDILTQLQSSTWTDLSQINKQIQLFSDTLDTIKSIENTTNFVTLNALFKKYVYLKKQIEWK